MLTHTYCIIKSISILNFIFVTIFGFALNLFFSPSILYKQEIVLTKDLAALIENFTIIAFIYCYDKDFQVQLNRRYSIVKAYTHEEMLCLTQR